MIEAGSPITAVSKEELGNVGRGRSVDAELARFNSLEKWRPAVGDFVIYHGWFRKRWYGIINAVYDGKVNIIKENLPLLLFTMSQDEYKDNSIELSEDKIKKSVKGTYTVLRDGVWHI